MLTELWLLAAMLDVAPRPASDPTQTASEPPRLSVAEAVGQALGRNDRLADNRDSVEQADLSVRLARSAFRPKVVPNILGSFGQTDVGNQTYGLDVSQRFPTGTELRTSAGASTFQNQLGSFYTTDTTLQVSQPLLRGFGRTVARRQLDAAEARSADARSQGRLTEQQVALEVVQVYYRLVAQDRLVDVARTTLDRSRRLLEASEAKLDVGKVSQLDVLRAQQLVAQAEGQLLDARAAADDARDRLRFLMGRDVDYDFNVQPEIPRAVETVTAEAAVATALAQRVEPRMAEQAWAEANRAVSYAKNQLLPQFDVSLALTRREVADSLASSFKLDKFRFATFFTISMPVNRTPAAVEFHNALIERDRRQRELKTLRMRIADEARRGVRQQERLAKGLEVAEASGEFARKELEVAELRYQRGFSNNLDVVNAEGNLLQAESRRIGTLADLAVARLALRMSMGVFDPRHDLGADPAEAE